MKNKKEPLKRIGAYLLYVTVRAIAPDAVVRQIGRQFDEGY